MSDDRKINDSRIFQSIVPVSEDVIRPLKISINEAKPKSGKDAVDGGAQNDFTSRRNVAEGMMDIALLTANANQLRLVLMLNTTSTSFYICTGLIVFSLVLQVIIGFGLIYKRHITNTRPRFERRQILTKIDDYLVGGIFVITVVNILIASFSATELSK